MRIAVCQMNPTVGDFDGNAAKIRAGYERGRAAGVDLVMFPELAVCGYPPADLLDKVSFVERAEAVMGELAKLTGNPAKVTENPAALTENSSQLTAGSAEPTRNKTAPAMLCGSVMRADAAAGKRVRNVAVLCEGGEVRFVQAKRLLPFYDVFDEQRYFEPAAEQSLAFVKGRPVAITICEDAWNDKGFWPHRNYAADPVEELMAQWAVLPPHVAGERVILNVSASPFWHGKRALRRRMLGALAVRHRAAVVLANQVGANDSLIFDGSSLAVAADGAVACEAAGFEEDFVVVETAELCAAAGGGTKANAGVSPLRSAALHSGRDDGGERALHFGRDDSDKGMDDAPETATREMWDALVLGVRDYVRKCGFSRVLVGLSGGIDSALVAAVAVAAVGAENVVGVGMPSEFSSAGSVTDAEALARNLGVRFTQIAVHEIYAQFVSALAPAFRGTEFGLAEENLQPRIRGSLLMALSNKTGALVLTTGNKSEMACGYCTLYGDMVGALAVIGDVYKTEVYALARYANRDGEVIPEATITKPPSAELRPGQLDTDSLPVYEVLDPVLRAYIEEYRGADEISSTLGVDVDLVRRVIGLVERAEYKRQQAAPVLKVSRKSFGMGRRFPIAVKGSE